MALALLIAQCVWAQTASSTEPAQSAAVLTKLSPPVYPPLARQAAISGDVVVQLSIAQDGSVKSAQLFSGNPMLAPAALESARKSQFECAKCNEPLTSYVLTYTYGFLDDGRITQVVNNQRVHAARCLYLWKCGTQQVTSYRCPKYRAPEVTRSPGHVTVLAVEVCVQTEDSSHLRAERQ